MASAFGTVAIHVYSQDAALPSPIPGELCDTYTATVRVGSDADLASLYAYLSRATEKPAMGERNLGTVVVEWGDGVRTLTFPTPESGERQFDAILISIEPTANMLHTDQWSVDCTWLLVDETP